MIIFHETARNPTHRRLVDNVPGRLLALNAGTVSNRPAVNPDDFERLAAPDAPAWKVKAWMVRNGIDLATIPAIIASATPAGPEREEALLRWAEVPTIPYTHPLVAVVAAGLSPAQEPADVWDDILSI